MNLEIPSPLTELIDERTLNADIRLWLKRDDLIHPDIPGNKWRKLKYNLSAAQTQGHTRLLTFGGAFSNHIRATAAAGRLFGFETVGVIRGEEHLPLNPSLAYAVDQGMRLSYLDRDRYRRKTSADILQPLLDEFGPCYVLPEGGSNGLAVRGCAELPGEISIDYDVICCACGTGGTLAGIATGAPRAMGFSVLKGASFLESEVRRLQADYGVVTDNWSVNLDFHFGGYARSTAELDAFVADFLARHGILLDWVYEAKMVLGLFALVSRGVFEQGCRVVAVLS